MATYLGAHLSSKGVAEQMSRKLYIVVRTLLHQKDFANVCGRKTFSTAAYVKNIVTSRTLPLNQTHYPFWNYSTAVLAHLHVFWSTCWYASFGSSVRELDSQNLLEMLIQYAMKEKRSSYWMPTLIMLWYAEMPLLTRPLTGILVLTYKADLLHATVPKRNLL